MKNIKFEEFMNLYDKDTCGKNTYYYKYLWNACAYAQDNCSTTYQKNKDKPEVNISMWLYSYKEYLNRHNIPEEIQLGLESKLIKWLKEQIVE